MIKKVLMDGCTAATHVSYALSEIATVYPITPIAEMGEIADKWAESGRLNVFGQTLEVKELESEAGASGALHGALSGGALATTYTASQGLLLMIPNMYKIAGELLPAVIHVGTRSIASHALTIFDDHQDIISTRSTGFAMLASASVQECMDLALVAHLSAIDSSVPFVHFFDGWRTANAFNTIDVIEYNEIASLLNQNNVQRFRSRAMNPSAPNTRGTAQNSDIYFQNREACNKYYDAVESIVQENMDKVAKLTGRQYHVVDYTGAADAEFVLISLCSSGEVAEETIKYLIKDGYKCGVVKVRLYRPFPIDAFVSILPDTTKKICVLNRSKEPGAPAEALTLDVISALAAKKRNISVVECRYGLGSKEFTPSMVKSILDYIKTDNCRRQFTIGINDDVTFTSIPVTADIRTLPSDTIQCKFYGIGADGSVGATKQIAKILTENSKLFVQAFFNYSAKKSGGYTISQLRYSQNQINSPYNIEKPDYLFCNNQSYIKRFDFASDLGTGSTFVVNTGWDMAKIEINFPAELKRALVDNKCKLYTIDAAYIAAKNNLGVRINTIMETVFFHLSNPIDFVAAVQLIKKYIQETYSHEGDDVVQNNYKAVDDTLSMLKEIPIPAEWTNAQDAKVDDNDLPEFIAKIAQPCMKLKGDTLPVSTFSAGGFVPNGSTAYEKRTIAYSIPQWDPSKCIQCCHCSYVCAHASIRPYVATDAELSGAPTSFAVIDAKGADALSGYKFRIQVYPEDCTGCSSCVNVCPGKALSMHLINEELDTQKINLAFAQTHIKVKDKIIPRNTVKGSQLQQPLLEFSGACAGCGETPYVKLLTQLFGERLVMANATGCSSIWGANMPSTAYCNRYDGRGPAWANSLFEDNAEYGYGIALALEHRRNKLAELITTMASNEENADIKTAMQNWLNNRNKGELADQSGSALIDCIRDNTSGKYSEIVKLKDLLTDISVWAVGGDGWAYDIGYGGLDHVLASGQNINVLVLDTECYSNTGGQMSKATPESAVAKYAYSGKRTPRKKLAQIAMTYKNVYVASVCMGANYQHTINALMEAEAYNGPSIVIAYCPCIEHGIRAGMGMDIIGEKNAVLCGYWDLFRYNPALVADGKNPLTIDSAKPSADLIAYINGENRYADLANNVGEDEAKELQEKLQKMCNDSYNDLAK